MNAPQHYPAQQQQAKIAKTWDIRKQLWAKRISGSVWTSVCIGAGAKERSFSLKVCSLQDWPLLSLWLWAVLFFLSFYIDTQPCVNSALVGELFLLPAWSGHIFCLLNFWVSYAHIPLPLFHTSITAPDSSSSRLSTVCMLYCTFQCSDRCVSRHIYPFIFLLTSHQFCLVSLQSLILLFNSAFSQPAWDRVNLWDTDNII